MKKKFQLNHTKKKVNLDAPETIVLHADIIKKKSFLRKIYSEIYLFFRESSMQVPDGLKIELGSGGGFIKEIIPDAITTDVILHSAIDKKVSAMNMPFENESVSSIFLFDVLHHIPDAEKFFYEAERVLKSGGRIIMVEPANTWWSRFIYKRFHHEPFHPEAEEWKLPEGGPMSMANGALPWIIFQRDIEKFKALFPDLKLLPIKYCYPFRYLISGGVSMKQLLPGFTYPIVKFKEEILFLPFSRQLGMFMKIVIEKK